MNALGLTVAITGVIIMASGVWETTRQALSDDLTHLSLRRWTAVWLLGIAPFVAIAAPLIWLGAWTVTG